MLVVLYTPNGQNLIYHRVWQKDLMIVDLFPLSPQTIKHVLDVSVCGHIYQTVVEEETRTRFPKYLAETMILV